MAQRGNSGWEVVDETEDEVEGDSDIIMRIGAMTEEDTDDEAVDEEGDCDKATMAQRGKIGCEVADDDTDEEDSDIIMRIGAATEDDADDDAEEEGADKEWEATMRIGPFTEDGYSGRACTETLGEGESTEEVEATWRRATVVLAEPFAPASPLKTPPTTTCLFLKVKGAVGEALEDEFAGAAEELDSAWRGSTAGSDEEDDTAGLDEDEAEELLEEPVDEADEKEARSGSDTAEEDEDPAEVDVGRGSNGSTKMVNGAEDDDAEDDEEAAAAAGDELTNEGAETMATDTVEDRETVEPEDAESADIMDDGDDDDEIRTTGSGADLMYTLSRFGPPHSSVGSPPQS